MDLRSARGVFPKTPFGEKKAKRCQIPPAALFLQWGAEIGQKMFGPGRFETSARRPPEPQMDVNRKRVFSFLFFWKAGIFPLENRFAAPMGPFQGENKPFSRGPKPQPAEMKQLPPGPTKKPNTKWQTNFFEGRKEFDVSCSQQGLPIGDD